MVKYNSNYGKLVTPCLVESDGVPVKRSAEIALAPHQIVTATRAIPCPTAEQYAEYGYLPTIRTTERVASAGHELVRVGWEERDGAIYGVWDERELPPRVRSFTPIALKRCLKLVGVWEEVKATLEAAGDVYDDFLTVTELKEDDPQFAPLLAAAKQRYGAELVDRIVEAASMGTEFVNTLTAADFAGRGE